MTVAEPEPPAQPPTTWIDALLTVVRDREITRNTASLLRPILATVLVAFLVVGGVVGVLVAVAVVEVGLGPALTAVGALGGVGGGGLLLRRRLARRAREGAGER